MKRFECHPSVLLLVTLVLATPSAGEAQVLLPSELCSDNPDTAIATFEDANLEAVVIRALFPRPPIPAFLLVPPPPPVGAQEDLTCGLVSGLTDLRSAASQFSRVRVIANLAGIQNLSGLTTLSLRNHSITDISPLSGLTSLTRLILTNNSIADLSALSGLASLTSLRFSGNPGLSNIQALLDNPGIEEVSLLATTVNCVDVALLKRNGMFVLSACH